MGQFRLSMVDDGNATLYFSGAFRFLDPPVEIKLAVLLSVVQLPDPVQVALASLFLDYAATPAILNLSIKDEE